MKISLPFRLRTALVAAVLTVAHYTLPLAHAEILVPKADEAELTKTTLDVLYEAGEVNITSAFEVALFGRVDNPEIIKYTYDPTEGYEVVFYSLTLDEPLGDTNSSTRTYFEFVNSNGIYSFKKVNSYLQADLTIAGTPEDRLTIVNDTDTISGSFFQLDAAGVNYGGAINNNRYEKKIGTIDGVFAVNQASRGGALYNGASHNTSGLYDSPAEIKLIQGYFIGNKADISGGAIYNTHGAYIESIVADFLYNTSDGNGGAICNDFATIGSIKGDFIGNTQTSSLDILGGGAIFNTGKIESIQGDFINNSALDGGAIANYGGEIVSITSNFTGNVSRSRNTTAAAIINSGTIIAPSFIGTITGDFMDNTAYGIRGASAINNYNISTIASLSGNIIGNTFYSTDPRFLNGAIYNVDGATLGLLAKDSSMTIVGNRSIYANTDETQYIGIYNGSVFESITDGATIYRDATLHFNTYGEERIIVNDQITGTDYSKSRQIIHINNGIDGAGGTIDNGGLGFSTVEFNNVISNQSIIVHAGRLQLGAYGRVEIEQPRAASIWVPSGRAQLNNSNLTINAGATVRTETSYLGDTLNSNVITNNGILELSGDEFNLNILGTGKISILTNMYTGSAAQFKEQNVHIASGARLELRNASTLNTDFSGVDGSLKFDEQLTINSHFSVGQLYYDYRTTVHFNSSATYVYDPMESSIAMVFNNASGLNGHQFITWDEGATMQTVLHTGDTRDISALDIEQKLFAKVGSWDQSYATFLSVVKNGDSFSTQIVDIGDYNPNAGIKLNATSTVDAFTITSSSYDKNSMSSTAAYSKWTVEGPLGDDFTQTVREEDFAQAKQFKWVTDASSNLRTLDVISLSATDGDFFAYSSNNLRELGSMTSVKDITHSFVGLSFAGEGFNNYAAAGAAVLVLDKEKLGNITGHFIGNTNLTHAGGAVAANSNLRDAYIGNITGDFLANKAAWDGGAIFNRGHIGDITGSFVANSTGTKGGAIHNDGYDTTLGIIKGNFISNYSREGGGAIYSNQRSTIKGISGDFLGNFVIYGGSVKHGAAIYNESSELTLFALDRSMEITGNYTAANNVDAAKNYVGIYNYAHSEHSESLIHFNAYGDKQLVINDAISGGTAHTGNQQLHINDGKYGDDTDINSGGLGFSTVVFNSKVENQQIYVYAGQLVLGEFKGNAHVPDTQALLSNVSLRIEEEGSVIAYDAKALGVDHSIVNRGSLHLMGGTLESTVNGYSNTGSLYISGEVTSNAIRLYNVKTIVNKSSTLHLTGGVLDSAISGSGSVIIAGDVSSHMNNLKVATTSVNEAAVLSLTTGGVNELALSGGGRVHFMDDTSSSLDLLGLDAIIAAGKVLSISGEAHSYKFSGDGSVAISQALILNNSIESAGLILNYDAASHTADSPYLQLDGLSTRDHISVHITSDAGAALNLNKLITWNEGDTVISFEDYAKQLVVTVDGTRNVWVTGTQDANSYGVTTLGVGPYNADASYVLTPTAEQTGFVVSTSQFDASTQSSKASLHELSFKDALGDDFGVSSLTPNTVAAIQYEWTTDVAGNRVLGQIDVKTSGGDLYAYSSNNVKESGASSIANARDIEHSFLNLNNHAVYNAGDHLGQIVGDFVNNTGSERGGAIHSRLESSIGSVTGHFVANHSTYDGGAIANHYSTTMGDITGDFIANRSGNYGGAIYNTFSSKIGHIKGDFIGNYSDWRGSAIYNVESTIKSISGNFLGNYSLDDSSAGAALHNEDGTVSLLALDNSMEFTGNYVTTSSGKSYVGIYNSSTSEEVKAKLYFNAYNGNSIVVNDAIVGQEHYPSKQEIHINNGLYGDESRITGEDLSYSTVVFNGNVSDHSITVYAGELVLGAFTGNDQVPSTQASLKNVDIYIHADAKLSSKAQYLGRFNDFTIEGTLALSEGGNLGVGNYTLQGGTISSRGGLYFSESNAKITVEGAGNTIKGTSESERISLNSSGRDRHITLNAKSELTIENATLSRMLITAGENSSLTLVNSIWSKDARMDGAAPVKLIDSTLQINSYAAPTPALTRGINADEYSYYTLTSNVLVSEVRGSLTLDITLRDESLLGIEGEMFGLLLTDTDGISLGDIELMDSLSIIINGDDYSRYLQGWSIQHDGLFILIPEPSTATLSLLALTGLLARRRRKAA